MDSVGQKVDFSRSQSPRCRRPRAELGSALWLHPFALTENCERDRPLSLGDSLGEAELRSVLLTQRLAVRPDAAARQPFLADGLWLWGWKGAWAGPEVGRDILVIRPTEQPPRRTVVSEA